MTYDILHKLYLKVWTNIIITIITYITYPIIQDRNIPIIASSKNESKLPLQSTFSKTYISGLKAIYSPAKLWTMNNSWQIPRVNFCSSLFHPKAPHLVVFICLLVGGFSSVEKYKSNWIISQSRGENKKSLKPAPSFQLVEIFGSIMSLLRSCSPAPLWQGKVLQLPFTTRTIPPYSTTTNILRSLQ